MWDGLKPGPQYEQLSQAIIQAILSSSEVQALVADLHEKGGLEAEDIVALALRFPPQGGLEAKVELMRRSEGEESGEPVEEEAGAMDLEEEFSGQDTDSGFKPRGSMNSRSPNEIAFENFLRDRFDSEAWMKKVGIRFLKGKDSGIFLNEGESPMEESEQPG
jgi:hypothetical protein